MLDKAVACVPVLFAGTRAPRSPACRIHKNFLGRSATSCTSLHDRTDVRGLSNSALMRLAALSPAAAATMCLPATDPVII